uniref:Alpha/beta hydrolase n=1 Tax=Caldilinea aerophila TaxID=133453 RepID=A0A7C1FGF2_9CHLR
MFTEWSDWLLLPLTALIIFLFWASLTPFETLGWWAGWFGNAIYHDVSISEAEAASPSSRHRHQPATAYVLFLSGIGRVSGQTLSYREQEFLNRLRKRLPDAVVIDNIFPYSVNNLALTGQPIFAGLWKWALDRKLDGPALAGYLINIRNLLQVAIAADKRYAPIYNQAMAEVMLDTVMRYDFDPNSTVPIFVIGYSGAGQIAIGAVTYLREWTKAPIYVISLGGIFSSDPGILAANHVFHLWGTRDRAQIWRLLMPGRWSWMAASEWNRALRQGRATIIRMEGMGHTGRGGYLDHRPPVEGGVANVDRTVELVATIIAYADQPERIPRVA